MTFEIKTLAEIETNIKINIVQNVDEIDDVNIGSVLDILVNSISSELEEQYTDIDTVYKGTRITTATGTDLEEIGLIVGVNRNQGSTATGDVTFIRNSPTSSNFSILSGSVVSTQPNTEVEQLNYTVTTTTVFKTSIPLESRLYIDGIYNYQLAQRFIDSVTALTATVSSVVGTSLTENTDFEITSDFSGTLINTTDFSLLNDCQTTGDWTQGDEALAPTSNTTTFLRGTKSINMMKSGTSTQKMSYTASPTSVDLSGLNEYTEVYIKDAAALAKITSIKLFLGTAGSANSYELTFTSFTEAQWNRLKIDLTNSSLVINGNPDISDIDYLKIEINTVATSNTFVAGDLLMGLWYGATDMPYEGDVIHYLQAGTNPDDDTNYITTYVPLSLEVPVVSEEVGIKYNSSKNKIIFKVTNIPNIDSLTNYKVFTGGIDKESDTNYRDRIKNSANLNNKATSAAIKANVEALTYVKSVTVEDLPTKSQEDEAHVYSTSSQFFVLGQKIPLDNANLIISDTVAGTADYIKDTDFELTTDGEVDFSIGGTEPVNGATVYANYDYKHLGNFNVLVSGVLGQLTTAQITAITTVVDNTRSVGTVATITQPTYVSVTVGVTLTIDSTYSTANVQSLVNDAIETYINGLGIGDDVLIAGIIDVCMDVDGVTNTVVTDIGGGVIDYVITSTQIASVGIITIV